MLQPSDKMLSTCQYKISILASVRVNKNHAGKVFPTIQKVCNDVFAQNNVFFFFVDVCLK